MTALAGLFLEALNGEISENQVKELKNDEPENDI